MTTGGDDVILVRNAVRECLQEAGARLHRHQQPSGTDQLAVSAWSAQPVADPHLERAQFWLARHQLLTSMDVDDAATYLREELLDAMVSAKEAEERRRATPVEIAVSKATGFNYQAMINAMLARSFPTDDDGFTFHPYRSAG